MSESGDGRDEKEIRPGPRPETDIAAELRLRPDPPRVIRLSRKTLGVLAAVGGLSLGAILIVALQDPKRGDGPAELFNTERVPTADELLSLPEDYSQVPQLGPPLPGELGRPVLAARERGEPVPVAPVAPGPAMDPEEQMRLQEQEAARLSRLFHDASTAESDGLLDAATPTGPQIDPQTVFPKVAQSGPEPDAVEQRQAFLTQPVDRRTISGERLTDPVSPYVLQAGSVIPAALVTGLRSDLPGQITAQVTQHIYDSPTGRFLLVPQGARLIGEYDSRVAFGQRRVLLVWTRMILPNGRSIVLERQPGADEAGYAGLEDGVDYHWGQLLRAAGLATILNIGLELGQDDDNEIAEAIRDGAQDTVGRAGDEIVRRQLTVPPTLTIRPGFPVRVMVTRDLILEPYES
ncbi:MULTISPECIES: TrbI/VirB10 family protein [unclassified Roseitalea]|uniref:TrbI/VirB10 family protein n=1 Tax=unclassified Roseitalea TaxID=2639107 RepID=UPI00273D25FD|nr:MULTISPECIES: TrbI/VirB10 family protein [unclassified Roseitalea]